MNAKPARRFLCATSEKGQAPIIATAGLAIALLLVAIAWRAGVALQQPNAPEPSLDFNRPSTEEIVARPHIESSRNWQEELVKLGLVSTSTEGVAAATTTTSIADIISQQFLDAYVSLKNSGRYTPELGAEVGRSIGSAVRAPSQFVVHGESEVMKDANTSITRALEYRADMRVALTILISDARPEFESFGMYIETKNPERLYELQEAAERYETAEQKLLSVVVPQDAAPIHLRVVNALGSYADSLRQLVLYADDPLSTLAVLRTYNDAEREMLYAFDALASYYVRKSSEN